jgi:predicted double-glycine peptidase
MPILPVPLIRQDTDYDCGAAAVRAVLSYYGVVVSEAELIRLLGTDAKDGTAPYCIVQCLWDFGFPLRAGRMSIPEVESWLDIGVPVILDLQAWADDPTLDYTTSLNEGHYVVARGYDLEHLYFSDPAVGEMVKLTRAELEARWHDTTHGVVYDHFGIAVSDRTSAKRVARAWMARR